MENELKNIFTSKAIVLEYLQKDIKKSTIEQLMYFTVEDWKNNQKIILVKIKKLFNSSKKIIIRSSAQGEDSIKNSFAGTYSSILDINPKHESIIKKGIESVIKSYERNNNFNLNNQILIQNQTFNVAKSGVIFTRTSDLGAPYYVINYEDGGTTTKTTHGLSNNTIKIFRNTKFSLLKNHWKLLLTSIKELEILCYSDKLDVEFAITNSDNIIIFQVRPITSIKNDLDKKSLKLFYKKLEYNKKIYSQYTKKSHIPGKTTIFSDMSDWNPAEIIGDNPNELDYSLYDYLITNNIWHKSRTYLGYQNVNPYKLMRRFGNKPFIDLRGSFNSLIPQNFSKKLTKKLINFYFIKLEENPNLHDKVEFQILFTCYDFMIDKRLIELKKYGFTVKEISEIKENLCNFTKKILLNESKIITDCHNKLVEMTKRRENILLSLENDNLSHEKLVKSLNSLLVDCKTFGTLPFSIMARLSFIGTIILKSFQEYSKSYNFYDSYISSLETPLTEIQNDLINYRDRKISKNNFLSKYGHLRPGTYDITNPIYSDNDEFLHEIDFTKKIKVKKFKFDEKPLLKLLSKELGFQFSIDVINVISETIIQREKLKFEFTKNLSLILELIALIGKNLGFSRYDMSNLDINTILKSKIQSKSEIIKEWNKKIYFQKNTRSINNNMIFPQVITSKKDFDIINYHISKPNFITNKITKNFVLELKKDTESKSIENSILLIKNADPGFDWIFTKKPAGLITKYGGVASHMSIRCAEIGLPAAIGCGELLFEKLKLSSKIHLDCKNHQIFILEHKKQDNYIEERKILKSLGYIK
jgi:phosphohistidine swiveling domain-containing protein